MRQKRTAQQSLFDPEPVHHPVADALEAISAWLDTYPELLDAIAADLGAAARGRAGLSCETVLRCAVLKHLRQETWRGLEFSLRDSVSARRFVRADPAPAAEEVGAASHGRGGAPRHLGAGQPVPAARGTRQRRRGRRAPARRQHRDGDTHPGAGGQSPAVRRRTCADALAGGSPATARRRCCTVPRSPQGGQAASPGGASATRAGAASPDLPPPVAARATHTPLCRWDAAGRGDDASSMGAALDA